MKRVFLISLLASSLLILISCKHSTDADEGDGLLSDSFTLKYEKICLMPIYQQSVMLTCYSDKILVYGSYDIMLYDTVSKSWQTTSIRGDSVRGRWDGAIGKINNSVYAFGAPFHPESSRHYNVMKLDVTTLALEELAEPLASNKYQAYPAYETYGNKILIVYPRLDSVYLFDAETQQGRFVARNELKVPESELLDGPLYAFGSYDNSLYLFNKSTKELGSINLSTFVWNKIEVPSKIKEAAGNYANGGIFDGLLLLFNGRNPKALCYDIKKNIWGYGNCDIHSDLYFETSYKNSKQFYFIDMPMDTVWCVTRIK